MATRLIGVDGCRGGWALAVADPALRRLEFALEPRIEAVVRLAEQGEALVAVDMPIGLPERGPRACDMAARALLGRPRASSVFPAPPRGVLEAITREMGYAEACAASRRLGGKALPWQLFALLGKLCELDALMTPALQRVVREAHPEVVFAVLSGAGHGLAHPKRTPDGERERLALLRCLLPPFDPAQERARLGASRVARHDLVDAAACLVAASHVAAGRELVLPSGTVPRDSRGLRMEIVA